MKKMALITLASFFAFFFLFKPAYATTGESTASSKFSDSEVQRLRDKIASQAARQRDTTRMVYFGNVSEKSANGFLVKTRSGSKQVHILEQSKLVAVTSTTRKPVELSSFILGTEVVAYGPTDSEGSMTASWVLYFPKKSTVLKREVLYGTLTELTSTHIFLKVRSGKTVTGTINDTAVFSSLAGVTLRSQNFSSGDTVVVVGYYDKDSFEVSGISLVKQTTQAFASGSGTLR